MEVAGNYNVLSFLRALTFEILCFYEKVMEGFVYSKNISSYILTSVVQYTWQPKCT